VSEAPDCVIDLGHTRVKWAEAKDGEVLGASVGACPLDDLSAFDHFLANSQTARAWLCGPAGSESLIQLEERIARHGLSLRRMETGAIDLPVEPAYSSLGCDRWMAMQWAWQESRDGCCVVDCGTAVTVDLVDRNGRHRGGWIMAGLAALRAGLLERAPRLPRQLGPAGDPTRARRGSAEAVAAGTLLQLIGAIDRAVAVASRELGQHPTVWLTGGDAKAVAGHLSAAARLDPWLVLRGVAMAAQRG